MIPGKERKMQGLLKDYLVEHGSDNKLCFSLTCSACGTVWKSTPVPGGGKEVRISARQAAAEEAECRNQMCSFCARPVCKNCYVNVEGISMCKQCAQRLRERVDAE